VSRYAAILRTPGIPVLVVATTLGRLPFGINGLAVLLFLHEVTGSFGLAGAGAGALALGAGLGGPFAARVVDRRGTGYLVPLAIAHATGLIALVVLGKGGAPAGVLVALAGLIGPTFPPTGAVLRARYPRLLGGNPELIRSAYALDSVVIELSFITGPLITAGVVALAGPELALCVSAGLVIAGALMFVAVLPRGDEPSGSGSGVLGALASPAVRAIALTTLPIGFCIGTIEVALPAFSHAEGRDELSGVLLAVWSAASAVGGLTFGAREARRDLIKTYMVIALLFPLACLPLAAATSPLAAVGGAILAGLPIAPLISSRNELLAEVAPSGVTTEAFTWLMTALIAGLSAGSAVAGALVEADGWPAAVLAGVAVAFAGAALSVGIRRSLVPAPSLG
jgi:MFS family permease